MNRFKFSGKLLLTTALAIHGLSAWSNPVDENTARQAAVKMLLRSSDTHKSDEAMPQKAESSEKTVKLLYKSSNQAENVGKQQKSGETVYFYIFVTEDNDGFVIVSGDDRMPPILGYSHTNGFSMENMPDNLKWWLDEYAKQIAYSIEKEIEPTVETKQQWEQLLENKESINDKK